MAILSREFIYLWYYFSIQVLQILPYWLIGMLLGSLVSVFGKAKIHGLFQKMQGKRLGLIGLLPASLLGAASPLCMFGTIPLMASFSAKGMREDWLAAFMMSSMLLNPQLVIYSTYLGPRVLAVRVISCLLCGIVAGLLVHVFYSGKSFFNFEGFHERSNRDTDPNPARRYLKSVWRNIQATGPYFLLGVVLTALFQRYVPAHFLAQFFGGRLAGFGVLMAAAVGVPVYVCGGGTIPLLMEWLDNGMSVGAAAAFMISGPATKITNLGALKIVLGAKRFLIYLAFVIAFACLTGLLVDLMRITPA